VFEPINMMTLPLLLLFGADIEHRLVQIVAKNGATLNIYIVNYVYIINASTSCRQVPYSPIEESPDRRNSTGHSPAHNVNIIDN
jgi:hypothetical protein